MKKKVLSVMLVGAMVMGMLAGCGSEKESGNGSETKSETESTADASDNLPVDENGDPSPFGKYKEPVTVEIVQSINPSIPLPEGDSATDNYYTSI